jgi:hypothetical protein
MSLFNRLKIGNKSPMFNLDAKLKNETFGMFDIWNELKESAPCSQLHKRLSGDFCAISRKVTLSCSLEIQSADPYQCDRAGRSLTPAGTPEGGLP